jgi:hypothetical protein
VAVHRIREFDLWQPGYGNATVRVYVAGTTTLAAIYTDEALTAAADNPQTLEARDLDGISYGKFAAPLYTGQAYYLDIDSADQTGIQRPALTSISGENASTCLVTATGGAKARTLADRAADFIFVADYGDLGASADTNTDTITAAVGAAAAAGGGIVLLPPGNLVVNPFTLPTGVRLEGEGRSVTVVQCQAAADVITLGGDRSGLARLTLDGINLVAGSVGVKTVGINETVFDDVEIKRFDTGIHCKGGRRGSWRDLYITNCTSGAKLHGDNNDGAANGDEFRDNEWAGGRVIQCTGIGLDLSYEDKFCRHNTIRDVGFEDNTGTAIRVNGARVNCLADCWWAGNTKNLDVLDDDNTQKKAENTVVGLVLAGGIMDGGTCTLTGTLHDVVFERMLLKSVTLTLTVPATNAILLQDCVEESVALTGDGTKLSRFRRIDQGATSGLTTDATATKAWSVTLEPGQVAHFEAVVIARQRNGTQTAEYLIAASAKRPGSTLGYELQTANFTVGNVLTGGTSGATARIIADSDSGTTGTLTMQDIQGDFIDDETITDTGSGSAKANGILVAQNATLLGSQTDLRIREDDAAWAAAFVANGPEIELRVTGAASKTIEWLVHVRMIQT